MGYYWRELCRPFLLSLYFSCFSEAVAITDIAGGGNGAAHPAFGCQALP
jgi:hypothetical protein